MYLWTLTHTRTHVYVCVGSSMIPSPFTKTLPNPLFCGYKGGVETKYFGTGRCMVHRVPLCTGGFGGQGPGVGMMRGEVRVSKPHPRKSNGTKFDLKVEHLNCYLDLKGVKNWEQ